MRQEAAHMGRNELTRCSRKDREPLSLKESGTGSSGCRLPCSIRQEGKIPPGGDGHRPGGPMGCTLQMGESLVMGKSPNGQREGKKTELLTSGCRGKMNLG